MLYIGIDPGQSGGMACLHYTGFVYGHTKMPETERDTFDWLAQFADSECFAVIEAVHSMPKQGVSSSFKFGQSYGFLRGCLIGSGMSFEQVTPQKWQKMMSCMTKGDKNVSKAKAQQLLPTLKITHATADALLLAAYAMQLHALRGFAIA